MKNDIAAQPKLSKNNKQKQMLVRLLTEGKILDIDNLTDELPYSSFFGCEDCGIKLPRQQAIHQHPSCPVCSKKMELFRVTPGMFKAWLLSGNTPKYTYVDLISRAQKITYSSRKAIEAFMQSDSCWDWKNNLAVFKQCARAQSLSEGMEEQCRYLLQEYLLVKPDDLPETIDEKLRSCTRTACKGMLDW